MSAKRRLLAAGMLVAIVAVVLSLTVCRTIPPEPLPQPQAARELVMVTWNLRGYPESEQAARDWFHQELAKLMPDVLCVQEIANQTKVNQFLSSESRFGKVAFLDSSDGQDNAIFAASDVAVEDMPDPMGFHPDIIVQRLRPFHRAALSDSERVFP